MSRARHLILWLTAACGLFAAPLARAAAPARDLTSDELKTFFDDHIVRTMARYRAPGAVCVVVQGDRVVIERGYGYADLRTETPMATDRTRFSVGSVSKTVTATAVMQLVERGQLSLDGDVAGDLPDLAIRNSFTEPVRVWHLLTHTAGFDEQFLGIAVRDPRDVPDRVERYAREREFVCEMPPGAFVSYSESNYLLAGCLIERLTGERFAVAVRRGLLEPAGMRDTSFEPPAADSGSVVQGYLFDGDQHVPMPPLWARTTPGAGLITTGADMGRFLRLHLDARAPGEADVLSHGSVCRMHERHFAYDGQADGMALGFFRHVMRGQTVLAHSGFAPGTSCELFLLPEHGVGAFVAYNVADTRLAGVTPVAFVEHFFASGDRDITTKRTTIEHATTGDPWRIARLCGSYRNISYSRRTAEKLSYLWETVSVWDNEDGTILCDAWGKSERFAPTDLSGFNFRQVEGAGDHSVRFLTDAAGNVTHLVAGTEGFVRLNWYDEPAAHRGVLRGSALVLAWACVGWPLVHGAARRFGRAPRARWTDRLLWATAALNLAFLVGLRVVHANTPLQEFVFGMPPAMRAVLAIPPLAAVMSLACAGIALRALVARRTGEQVVCDPLLARAHFALVSLAAVGLIPLLIYWNLLG